MMDNKKLGKRISINRIKNFPISFLSIALGLMGFALAFVKIEEILNIELAIGKYIFYFAVLVSVTICLIYIRKIILFPKEVKKEFNHPIKLNFYPILAKLFLISSVILISSNFLLSKYIWWAGIIVQFVFTIIIMSAWLRHDKFKINHINPSWFIPVVGSIIIPITGVKFVSPELSWFFFSIGLFWWLILTIIVINRMIFFDPLPQKLVPTFFILFAPPVIGTISLVKLLGELTVFAKLLYYFGMFLFILILFQANMFFKLRFYLSWWGYTFPTAAFTVGTLLMFHETQLLFFKIFSWFSFGLLSLIILLLLVKTLSAISKKEICIEEED